MSVNETKTIIKAMLFLFSFFFSGKTLKNIPAQFGFFAAIILIFELYFNSFAKKRLFTLCINKFLKTFFIFCTKNFEYF